jgi:hypothetical protein
MPSRKDPKKKEAPSGGLPNWVIALGIGVVVIIAAVGLFVLQTPQATTPAQSNSSTVTSGRTKGDPNAKLELIEYSDFQ